MVPVVILFFITGLLGHNTGRLSDIPVIGPPWDQLTTKMIDSIYDALGIYLGVVGALDKSISDHVPVIGYYRGDDYLSQKLNGTCAYPYWSCTGFPREELPEILQSEVVQNFVTSVIADAEKRVEEANVPREDYLLYLRGTAYEAMVERAKYCAGGPTKDPRYVVSHCGDCDDWHVIAYAIISRINEKHDINARYFLTMTMDHAFLTVYYPDEGMWEIYDWFPPIGQLYSENSSSYIELNGHCPYLYQQDKCVVKIRRFGKYYDLQDFYAHEGEGNIGYIYEFPNLRYVSLDDLLAIEGDPVVKHLSGNH
ncbi:hypothetical protein [Thermococcus kodakarensis]|uniref:hypothetical protein n=1 Tax=Thermococcus kodakarensis TaxID=311400 RepID=UPI001E509DBD|nr:hypothetical protein [Thermococcus kodakarensis]WCN27604.1 hypothetical protein POG15_08565 [Thermococcus kodakarensis]